MVSLFPGTRSRVPPICGGSSPSTRGNYFLAAQSHPAPPLATSSFSERRYHKVMPAKADSTYSSTLRLRHAFGPTATPAGRLPYYPFHRTPNHRDNITRREYTCEALGIRPIDIHSCLPDTIAKSICFALYRSSASGKCSSAVMPSLCRGERRRRR